MIFLLPLREKVSGGCPTDEGSRDRLKEALSCFSWLKTTALRAGGEAEKPLFRQLR
jgi:hypothetical protein